MVSALVSYKFIVNIDNLSPKYSSVMNFSHLIFYQFSFSYIVKFTNIFLTNSHMKLYSHTLSCYFLCYDLECIFIDYKTLCNFISPIQLYKMHLATVSLSQYNLNNINFRSELLNPFNLTRRHTNLH